jgi:hypothetical protein
VVSQNASAEGDILSDAGGVIDLPQPPHTYVTDVCVCVCVCVCVVCVCVCLCVCVCVCVCVHGWMDGWMYAYRHIYILSYTGVVADLSGLIGDAYVGV